MSDLFHLVRGITQGTADYVQKQRDIQRAREDKELEFVRGTLNSMASRPDFDSSAYASLINYMHQLSQPRAQKKGMAGLMGQHEELPISQMISTVTHGDPSKPFVGDPTQTAISDDKLNMLGGRVGAGTQDPTKTAPSSAQAPEPAGGTAPTSAAPTPVTPSAAAGLPAPPLPSPPPALQAPPPLQPQPAAALPQTPGTAKLTQSVNDMAMDQTAQATGPQLPAPPTMPPGMSDADLAAAQGQRGAGMQSWFKTPKERSIEEGQAGFRSAVSASAGKMEGARVELRQMLGHEPTLAELRQYMTGRIGTKRVVWQQDPANPQGEVAMLEDSQTGELSPAFSADGKQLSRLKGAGAARAQQEADVATATGVTPTAARGVVAGRNVAEANAKLNNLNLTAAVKQQVLKAKSLDEAVKIMNASGIDLQTSLDVARSVIGSGGAPRAGAGAAPKAGAGALPAPPGTAAAGKPGAPDLSGIRKVTGQTQSMMEGAKMLQPHIPEVVDMATQLDKAGLFGPLMSRVRDVATRLGTVQGLGSSNLDEQQHAMDALGQAIASDPELAQDELSGQFAASLGLLMTGAARVHGGSRGGGSPQMLDHFKSLLGSAGTLKLFRGRMNALNSFIGGYAKGPGGAPPSGGAAAGGGGATGTVRLFSPKTGKTYNIPAADVPAFKKDHPGAKEQ